MQQPEKQCNKCHQWLPYSSFHPSRSTKDGMRYWCKSCTSEYAKQTRTPEIRKKQQLRTRYGITLSQYDRILEAQGGVCAVCKLPESSIHWHTKSIRPLAVDHDHRTGDVRALLCNVCNTSLGQMREDPERIRALLSYAEWCQTREPDTKIIQLSMMEDDASGF